MSFFYKICRDLQNTKGKLYISSRDQSTIASTIIFALCTSPHILLKLHANPIYRAMITCNENELCQWCDLNIFISQAVPRFITQSSQGSFSTQRTFRSMVLNMVLLHNLAAHNVSIQNVKVSKHERHKMYSVTKRTLSQNVL